MAFRNSMTHWYVSRFARNVLSELTEVSVRPEVHGSQILLPLTD